MNKMLSVVVTSVFCVTGYSYCSEVVSPELTPFVLSLAPTGAETTGEVTTRNGWYITPNVGLNIISGINYDLGLGVGKIKVDFDDGVSFGVSVGNRISEGVKVQFDFSHYKNDIDNSSGTGFTIDGGEIEQFAIMTTVMWQGDSGNVQPYFGIGAGAIREEHEIDATLLGVAFTINGDDWAFAFQVLAGASVKLSPSSQLLLNYRFLHADYDNEIENHTFGIGIQITF